MAYQVVKVRKKKDRNSVEGYAYRYIAYNRQSGELVDSRDTVKTVRVRNGNYYSALKGLFT